MAVLLLWVSAAQAGGFKDLGNSARIAGIGGAGIALSDAPYTQFYNPATIYGMDRVMVSSTYSRLLPGVEDDDLNFLSLSGIVPMDFLGHIGVGGSFLNTNLWKEYTLSATYAHNITSGFSVGGAFKLLGWSATAAPGEKALTYTGFTFDAGAFYSSQEWIDQTKVSFGVSARNITQPSISVSGSSDANLPIALGFGVALQSFAYNYLVAADVVKEADMLYVRGGLEFLGMKSDMFGVNSEFYIRAGYNRLVQADFSRESGVNAGFSVNVDYLKIDYAFVYPVELKNTGGNHKISLGYTF